MDAQLFKDHDFDRMVCFDHPEANCCPAGCHNLTEHQYEHYARITSEAGGFDSTVDTMRHSRRVDELLLEVLTAIQSRLTKHDASKLEFPEKEIFDEMTPKLRELTYGTPEYKASLVQMGAALEHHYAENRHHPEHFENGVAGMTLVDLIEMLADWKAATERHADGDLVKSLGIQKDRFELSDQLASILENTARTMGWIGATEARCSCGNYYADDNLCMKSACQWER